MPTRHEYLNTYAQGWIEGDAEMILSATAPGYNFDDPRGSYLGADFRKQFAVLRAHRSEQPFMELSEVLVQDTPVLLAAWCWWRIPGVAEGSGLIKVGDAGVLSEKIAYY